MARWAGQVGPGGPEGSPQGDVTWGRFFCSRRTDPRAAGMPATVQVGGEGLGPGWQQCRGRRWRDGHLPMLQSLVLCDVHPETRTESSFMFRDPWSDP